MTIGLDGTVVHDWVDVVVTREQLSAVLKLEANCWSIDPDSVAVFDGKRWELGIRSILGAGVVAEHCGKGMRLVTQDSRANSDAMSAPARLPPGCIDLSALGFAGKATT